MNYPLTVMQSVWRRIRRPSQRTMRGIDVDTSGINVTRFDAWCWKCGYTGNRLCRHFLEEIKR